MMQQPPKTMEMLHPVDVGAATGRPRATNRRPYEVYRYIFEFCNRPKIAFLVKLWVSKGNCGCF